MDKSMLIGMVLGIGGAMAGGALAGYAALNVKEPQQAAAPAPQAALAANGQPTLLEGAPYQPQLAQAALQPQFADVIGVDPVTTTSHSPQKQCRTEQVVHRKPVKDSYRVTGTVIGGALGGALGNRIGKGHGRDAATVAGVLVGGYVGNRVQKNIQQSSTYTTTERRCSTVMRSSRKTIGYDVTYRWNGTVNTVRMSQRPGDRLPVQNGEVIPVSARNLARYD